MADPFHYPPEVLAILVDTIPLLCKSKQDVFLFFRGAGVHGEHLNDLYSKFHADRNAVNKFAIARQVLVSLNEGGDSDLAARREVIKRVVQFEEFASSCWPDDVLKAKGLVSDLRKVVDVKDSFARMKQERDSEHRKAIEAHERRVQEVRDRQASIDLLRVQLFSLFNDADAQARGRKLEPILNELFRAHEMLVSESFVLRSAQGRVIEQIDGVVAFDGDFYLVEMKWYQEPIGPEVVAQHLVRVFHRGQSRGVLLSASPVTEAALAMMRESLKQAVFVLMTLDEVVFALEQRHSLKEILRTKVQAAIVQKQPYVRVVAQGN